MLPEYRRPCDRARLAVMQRRISADGLQHVKHVNFVFAMLVAPDSIWPTTTPSFQSGLSICDEVIDQTTNQIFQPAVVTYHLNLLPSKYLIQATEAHCASR